MRNFILSFRDHKHTNSHELKPWLLEPCVHLTVPKCCVLQWAECYGKVRFIWRTMLFD